MKKSNNPFWALLISGILNVLMGVIEIISGLVSGSSSLVADSLDFFIDGVNYFSSIFILRKSDSVHNTVGKIKGYLMILMAVAIFIVVVYKFFYGWVPSGEVMTLVGVGALFVNVFSAFLLQKFQHTSLDLRAVWLCTRNDAIGNVLIIIAGYLTLEFMSPYPDIIVSVFIGFLIFKSGLSIIQNRPQVHNHTH